MYRVNIEKQWICVPPHAIRGIPSYIINIINSLVLRNNNHYSISFFDQNKERNNRQYMVDYLGEDALLKLDVLECNSESYRTVLNANISANSSLYDKIPYSGYIGGCADVYHFPASHTIPFNVDGRIVVTVHDILPLMPSFSTFWGDVTRGAFEASMRYMEKREDIILIADSQSTKNDVVHNSRISPERIHVVPLAYDKGIHYPEQNIGLLSAMGINTPYLLYLGALDFRKGVVDIIDAFEILKPRFKEIKLVLAGELKTEVKPIHDRLVNCCYNDDIILPGFVNDNQKRALLSSASVFLFPSEYEGFGLPVLEAMACGSPVITTDVSSLPEVGGDAVVYISPKNPEQLAFEIERLLGSETLRDEYIQKGFKKSAMFSWDKTAQMTEEVYEIAYRG